LGIFEHFSLAFFAHFEQGDEGASEWPAMASRAAHSTESAAHRPISRRLRPSACNFAIELGAGMYYTLTLRL
jgi:hypothetical protein